MKPSKRFQASVNSTGEEECLIPSNKETANVMTIHLALGQACLAIAIIELYTAVNQVNKVPPANI